ncbi:uncharacterized protein LOC134250528, partial [Saccostrea cucullata]|uniref:uncharacterized protein LOC134250528 n=1 Tax=Saccostrea cuccullata TaxID=36930 RepID=UPI002ED458BB
LVVYIECNIVQLQIPCSNTSCKLVNNVPTGKRKDRIWDANVKLASATVNAGIGERQLNTLLSDLNIPPVSHTTLLARQRDVGIAFREMAKESTEKALQEEINLTKRKTGSEDLTVSVDAGWQKRGSGRSYDSLSEFNFENLLCGMEGGGVMIQVLEQPNFIQKLPAALP